MKLTTKQKEAVHAVEGNVLVHAGAGSGKTAVFTARIANLIANHGVEPESILGMTFTNEAAENMKSRLGDFIGKGRAKRVQLSTFHSFAYRILKQRYASEYNGKTVMKHWWKMQQLYDIVSKPKGMNDVGLSLPCKAGELGSFISYQKANMVKGGMKVLWRPDFDSLGEKHQLQKAFDKYCELVQNARIIGFDDMLVDLYYKLLEDETLLSDIKDEYEYIMVDEFQDTNKVSMEILKLIADENLFVVGDFRQGIYGFINANIENILGFTDDFKDVNLVELEDNFRSTENIVDFANHVVRVSPIERYKQFDEQVSSRGEVGSKVSITMYRDEVMEAESIMEEIESAVEDGKKYEDFAILSRTNAQLGFYESMFADNDIPVDVSNTRSFFDRREIADILSYAEHAVDGRDGMSMKRVMNSPNRFISKSDINKLDAYAYRNNMSFEDACREMKIGRSETNIKRMLVLFSELRDGIEDMNAATFLKSVYRKTSYRRHIEKTSSSSSDFAMKEDSINRLFDIAAKFMNVEVFLAHVSIIKNNSGKNKEGVKLMTVHASKGLEFENVYIPTVTDENFPHDMNSDTEEERRLFYVAASRAKNNMSISAPVFTPTGSSSIDSSPFLEDVVGEKLKHARKTVMLGENFSEVAYGG